MFKLKSLKRSLTLLLDLDQICVPLDKSKIVSLQAHISSFADQKTCPQPSVCSFVFFILLSSVWICLYATRRIVFGHTRSIPLVLHSVYI